MRLVVISHKPCWPCGSATSGFASSGGFPFQMHALAQLFDETTLAVPVTTCPASGEIPLSAPHLRVRPLSVPQGIEGWRKLLFPIWILKNLRPLVREIRRADAVHVPIPGDIGTIGMLLAYALRKPLFVRYCGNWFVQQSAAERFWKWFMESTAGGRNVMLATGGASDPPSRHNDAAKWIFSTTLTEEELRTSRAHRRERTPDQARLIIVCRQEGGKGTEVLIDSLPAIIERLPNATLDIVGDGPDLPSLRQRALSSRFGSRVTFHGAVDHASVLGLLRQADVFCYPTATEGFPKVVLEALACGLPIVTTNVSVLPHLVHGCGVLLDVVTPQAVADAVWLCLAEPERYRAMSARATERAQNYSLERWRDTIGDYLRAAWGPLQSRV
jgi:glycosyltransferase involved in cell wall biosynthesis